MLSDGGRHAAMVGLANYAYSQNQYPIQSIIGTVTFGNGEEMIKGARAEYPLNLLGVDRSLSQENAAILSSILSSLLSKKGEDFIRRNRLGILYAWELECRRTLG